MPKGIVIFYNVASYFYRESRRYYLPSCIKQSISVTKRAKTRLVQLSDADASRDRILSETRAIWGKLDPNSGLNDFVREGIRKETDIRRKALFHAIHSVVPFDSFPTDTMHLGYNLAKDILEILKGEHRHLLRV